MTRLERSRPAKYGAAPKRRYARLRAGGSLHCPECGSPFSMILETRHPKGGAYIRRRRECGQCGLRYTTMETPC